MKKLARALIAVQVLPLIASLSCRPIAGAAPANPLLAPWSGPYGGVPPFDAIGPGFFPAALEAALAERAREIEAIRANPQAPTYANTVEALERAGATLERVGVLFSTYSNSLNDQAFAAVEREWAPRLAAAEDQLLLDGVLFARVQAVSQLEASHGLSPEQQRLLERTQLQFALRGATLGAADKAKLAVINQKLAALYTIFGQKVLADENTWIVLDSSRDLAGLPDGVVAGLAAAAAERGLQGRWAVVNTRSSVDPFLAHSSRRDLRERVWRAFKNRGDNGDANDTNATIARIVALRLEKAHLLGYPSFAAWRLANTMAKTPARARQLMDAVWPSTVARVERDVAEMQVEAKRDAADAKIEPWDYLYYAEQVRKRRYALDENELKPYFTLDNMIRASFWMAQQLYGLSLTEVTGKVPVFHPDVRVWEVRGKDGGLVGLFYGDYFARPGKNSGAWELPYRRQSRLDGAQLPLVSNNNNFVKGKPGEPVTISLDDARVLFHEFGHALHDLLSDVTYSSLAGTNTVTDFGEVPSEIHENWALTPEVLDRFALHVRTGKPIPQALREKVVASGEFNQGYLMAEYLAAAIVDMDLHSLAESKVDPDTFEGEDLARIGMPPQIAMRHRLPQFTHLFTSDEYAAGYYSYLWSESMSADAWEAFTETQDAWNPAVAARLRAVLAAGDSVDPAELFRRFRGRDADVAALLRQRGLR